MSKAPLLRKVTARENELGLIAACWTDDENAISLLTMADDRDFTSTDAREQFRVLKRAWVDLRTTFPGALKKISADLGFVESFQVLSDEFVSGHWAGMGAKTLASLFRQVREEATRARVHRFSLEITDILTDPDRNLDQAQDAIARGLTEAFRITRGNSAQSERELLEELAVQMAERKHDEEQGKACGAMSTGLKSLDAVLGGIEESDLLVVAARPQVGKTAFGLSVGRYIAGKYGPVLMISLELSKGKIGRRIAAQELQKRYDSISAGEVFQVAETRAKDFHIDADVCRPEVLGRKVDLFRLLHPNLKLVIIDHLGILAGTSSFEEVTKAINACRDTMKQTGVPLMVLAQLGRDVDKRNDKRPQMSDLFMSSAIEQDARKIVLLHRPWIYDKRQPASKALAIVAKNGEGETGDVQLHYTGPTFTFSDATHAQEPPVQAKEEEDVWEGLF